MPSSNRFSPRVGLAYSPGAKDGILSKLTGGPEKTSIRAGYGIYYSVIEGNTMAVDEPQPPYGLSYTSPGPPLFQKPFITASNGSFTGNPFPLTFPPLNASPQHPNSSIDFSGYEPIAGMTAPPPWNKYPYNENYFLSIERQFGGNTVLSLSYVGSQAHHLLLVYSANPGNPALCLALSKPSAVAPDTPTCGPFGEDTTYITAARQTIQGTRSGLGPAFANDDYDASVGNSNYNAFELTLRHSTKSLTFLIGYTYSKSIDQASSISDPGNPYDFDRHSSAFVVRFASQFRRQLSIQTSLRAFFRTPEGIDQRVGDFRNHASELRFSSDAAFRRRQLADGKHSEWREQSQPGLARLQRRSAPS